MEEINLKNSIVAGDYKGKSLIIENDLLYIVMGLFKKYPISRDTVEEYEVMDENSRISASSAIGRAFIGSVVLGPAGLLAAVSAKKKDTVVVAVQFKDGKKSLMELNGKYYKCLVRSLFI